MNQNQFNTDVRGVAVDMLVKLEHAYPDSREGSTISNMKACAAQLLGNAPESVQNGTADMWTHYCEVGENLLSVAYGAECSWCGARE